MLVINPLDCLITELNPNQPIVSVATYLRQSLILPLYRLMRIRKHRNQYFMTIPLGILCSILDFHQMSDYYERISFFNVFTYKRRLTVFSPLHHLVSLKLRKHPFIFLDMYISLYTLKV